MGRLENHGIKAQCGSSGTNENSGYSIYVDDLRAWDADYKVVEKSKKARKKRRKVKKDLEDDIQAAEGTVYGPGIADWLNVTSWGDLWWDSQSKSDYQLSPRNGVFGVTTVHGAQRREFALHPGYTQQNIFGKLKDRALEWTSKNFPGPTNNELIFLESSTFSSAAVPKISSSLEYQKKTFCSNCKANWGSFQSYTIIKVLHAACFTRF